MYIEVKYRQMTVKDIDSVVRVEKDAFPLPWTADIFQHELEGNSYSYYLVAEVAGEIVGYCGMWIVLDECHITNVAVHSSYQGRGIGEGLMRTAIERCYKDEVVLMTLEVRVSNAIAQNLYRKLGFQNGGIRKKYYSDDNEDALVMWVEFK